MLGSSSSVANPEYHPEHGCCGSTQPVFTNSLRTFRLIEWKQLFMNLLKETITEHKRIIFNGNGYTDEWLKEAADRGLYNLVSTPDALPHFTDRKE